MTAITVGTEIPPVSDTATLARLVQYAGASGDLNPLHFDTEFAAAVSPTGGLIAHGMLSMGLVSRAVTAFAGGPEHVCELTVRFVRPWPVDTVATFGGKVTEIADGIAALALWGDLEDGSRMLRGSATIRL
ncbi:MAG: MaoC/PaaZ C-terminal domain-containing protein [Nitriliruptoraceae bacterium]